MKTQKTYLITGGCGFIGTSLIAHLLKNDPDTKIRVLDNLCVGTRDDLAEVCTFKEIPASSVNADFRENKVELIVGDIRNYAVCEQACEGIDIIVHLAANTGVGPSVEDPRADMESNVVGIFNMLEAARLHKTDKFIFASSGAPIGEVEPPITEDKPAKPVSPYGASKLAGEGYCSAYYRTFKIKTVSLRFGNVYGPRSKHKSSVVAKFIKQALAGETLEIYGDGSQTRDFIYIDDLINAVMLAAHPQPASSTAKAPWGEIFQIATHKETTVNEIGEKIKVLFERQARKTLTIIHGNTRLGDVKRNYSDITKARNVLGYKPDYDLDKGLRMTYDYFASRRLS
jgi:UDP-glucose 4-epimerase